MGTYNCPKYQFSTLYALYSNAADLDVLRNFCFDAQGKLPQILD